jgi:hypothetical protein
MVQMNWRTGFQPVSAHDNLARLIEYLQAGSLNAGSGKMPDFHLGQT